MKVMRPLLVVTAFLLAACCLVYPALVTGVARAAFSRQANGSLLERDGKVVGSALIGQTFEKPLEHLDYFWGRPSAASVDGPTGVLVSGGSNYGPLNPALKDEVSQRIAALRSTGALGPIPADLVTKSGSGLDPHISVAAADLQIPRVAKARGMREDTVRDLVREHTEDRSLGFLGERRVDVLALNLALDEQRSRAASR